ncbi:MAG: hypothetical protein LIO85_04555 [Rikenellaceae bacterium]|nr:hypothetical protein [Rikenellaceae bacterium]
MIEKDYITRLLADLGKVIAKLLQLKASGNKIEMEQAVWDGLAMAGVGEEPLIPYEDAVAKIEDERVLASLAEAINIYLSVGRNENLVRIKDLINRRLKEKKSLLFNTEILE